MRIVCWMLLCLSHRFLPWCMAAAPTAPQDGSVLAPAPEASPLTNQVDLRPIFERHGLPARLQGSRPTCSAFTVAGAIEFAAAERRGRGVRYSVEFLNWSANQIGGHPADGGFFSDLWKGFDRYGICTEDAMPYLPSFDPAQPPSSAALAEANTQRTLGLRLHWIKEWNVHTGLAPAQLLALKRTLAQGWPVCGGFRWPKRERWIEHVLQLCPPDAVRDGHSVLLVGYRDDADQPGGGVFVFRNTSHPGEDGFMPYEYAQEYMNDAAWVDFDAASPGAGAPPAGARAAATAPH